MVPASEKMIWIAIDCYRQDIELNFVSHWIIILGADLVPCEWAKYLHSKKNNVFLTGVNEKLNYYYYNCMQFQDREQRATFLWNDCNQNIVDGFGWVVLSIYICKGTTFKSTNDNRSSMFELLNFDTRFVCHLSMLDYLNSMIYYDVHSAIVANTMFT